MYISSFVTYFLFCYIYLFKCLLHHLIGIASDHFLILFACDVIYVIYNINYKIFKCTLNAKEKYKRKYQYG